GLRRKVHDGVDLLRPQNIADQIQIANVAVHKLEVGLGGGKLQVLHRGHTIQDIQAHDGVSGVFLHEMIAHVTGNEPSSTSNKNLGGGVDGGGGGHWDKGQKKVGNKNRKSDRKSKFFFADGCTIAAILVRGKLK